ncbi:unnamed protein product [Bursaphelenchus xylophilus]|uniref:(pine wood nematode) hypothetical protein n=1 Tax=Bursaphelenchus xylophilus TaxID=6326 RepID=A0A1I7RQG0_BURXY|nr:unnamed protein product [Bursaphelenchus xylophilus]CAG9104511.1 unnamed protein product [Bursaphelenchus xylophilus]
MLSLLILLPIFMVQAGEYLPKMQVVVEVGEFNLKTGCLDETLCTVKTLDLSTHGEVTKMRFSRDFAKIQTPEVFIFTLYKEDLKSTDLLVELAGIDPQFGFDRVCDEMDKPFAINLNEMNTPQTVQLEGMCFTLTAKITIVKLFASSPLKYDFLVKKEMETNLQIILIVLLSLLLILLVIPSAFLAKRFCTHREKPLKMNAPIQKETLMQAA